MPIIKQKVSFSPQHRFPQESVFVAQNLLKDKKTLVFHGGGGKGRVLPAVVELLQAYGLKKTPERVVGISAGCFMALAIALRITEKKDLLDRLKTLPFETFKARTWKRTVRLFRRILVIFFPNWFGGHVENSFDWAYYDSGGIREYVRKQIVGEFEDWKLLEEQSERDYKSSIKKDPSFAELYERTGVTLEIHVTVAEELSTKVYSHLTTPNEKISLAFQASTSIPGVYPPVEMVSGNKAVDGGMSDGVEDFSHIPLRERLHIRMLDDSASELWYGQPKYVALDKIEDFIKRILARLYVLEYKNFPSAEKEVSIPVAVPIDTLHYIWTEQEQHDYDFFACAQTYAQLRKMLAREVGGAEAVQNVETSCPAYVHAFDRPPPKAVPRVVDSNRCQGSIVAALKQS